MASETIKSCGTPLPKIIWFLWLQGITDLPFPVNKCLASWKTHNPGWDLVFLDRNTIHEHLDIERITINNKPNISIQALSDIIRINLLDRYGGVWVDATCYCRTSLDSWLFDYMNRDFFAFSGGSIDRPVESWFLASRPNSILTESFCLSTNDYWQKNIFSNQYRDNWIPIRMHLDKFLRNRAYQSLSARWGHSLMNSLKLYPYFWFPYLFGKLLMKDIQCRKEHHLSKQFNASQPERLHQYGLLKPVTDGLKLLIDTTNIPLFKLSWRLEKKYAPEGSVLDHLLKNQRRSR